MSKDITTVLHQTAVKIMEELVLLFFLPADDTAVKKADPMTTAVVTFSGPFSGTLVMKLSTKILPVLAANMLGADDHEEIALDDQFGSLTETLNIICGNFLPELAGKKKVFDIDQPKMASKEELHRIRSEQAATSKVLLKFEDGLCEFNLFINSWLG